MPSLLFVLRRSKNFTSVAAVRMPPSVSIDHYLGSKRKDQQNRTEVLFHHSMLRYSGVGIHLL